jgi:hypothetical protein
MAAVAPGGTGAFALATLPVLVSERSPAIGPAGASAAGHGAAPPPDPDAASTPGL